ncbi:MAG: hypothetical protein WBW69_00870, partial [Candidatus Korobacteraceae bacterium]
MRLRYLAACLSAELTLVAVTLFVAIPAFSQQKTEGSTDLVLVGAKVYASPTAQPIDDAVVVMADGKIAAIGTRGQVQIP